MKNENNKKNRRMYVTYYFTNERVEKIIKIELKGVNNKKYTTLCSKLKQSPTVEKATDMIKTNQRTKQENTDATNKLKYMYKTLFSLCCMYAH